MSEHVELGKVALTSDSDGFLSRQCPSCGQVFKRPVARMKGDDAPPAAYCPYCSATSDARWDTNAQSAYLQAHMNRLASDYVHRQFREMLDSLSSSSFRVSHGEPDLPPDPGSPPPEPEEGFIQVHVPCHPDDPFKVSQSWSGEVACPICGIPYPIADVADLGGSH